VGASAGLAMMGGSSLVSGLTNASALKSQAEYQRQQGEINAQLADMQAGDVIARGDVDATKAIKAGDRMVGEQRAALAASGVDVNYGSSLDAQNDTKASAMADARTIKSNAWREAWGIKTQANTATAQAGFNYAATKGAAANSIATGGMNALSYGTQAYGKYKDNQTPKGTK